jgi:hypothetical protein
MALHKKPAFETSVMLERLRERLASYSSICRSVEAVIDRATTDQQYGPQEDRYHGCFLLFHAK